MIASIGRRIGRRGLSGVMGGRRWTPASLDSLALWIEPQQNGGAEDSAVPIISDLSGAGNDFVQLGATPVPIISTAAFGGTKSLLYSGAQSLALAHAASVSLADLQAGSFTWALLVQPTALSEYQTILAKGGGDTRHIWYMTRSPTPGMLDTGGGFLDAYNYQRAYRPGNGRNRQFLAGVPHVVTVRHERLDASNSVQTIRVDGELCSIYTGAPIALETVSPWTLGSGYNGGAANFFLNGHIGLVVGCAEALSVGEAVRLEAYAARLGGVTLRPNTGTGLDVLLDGDSITFSDIPDTGNGWPVQMRAMYVAAPTIRNRAIGGQTLGQIVANPYLQQVVPGSGDNVAILAAGTNDIAEGRTSAQLATDAHTWATAMRAVGYTKLGIATILPRSSFDATQEGHRITHNQWSRDAVGTTFDFVIDNAADARLANPAVSPYTDGTHPNATGQGYLAANAYTAVEAARLQ